VNYLEHSRVCILHNLYFMSCQCPVSLIREFIYPPQGVFTPNFQDTPCSDPNRVSKHVHLLKRDMVLYTLYSMKFGHLILRNIIKFFDTRCHNLTLKAPNSRSAVALLQTPLGELTALPRLINWIKGAYF